MKRPGVKILFKGTTVFTVAFTVSQVEAERVVQNFANGSYKGSCIGSHNVKTVSNEAWAVDADSVMCMHVFWDDSQVVQQGAVPAPGSMVGSGLQGM